MSATFNASVSANFNRSDFNQRYQYRHDHVHYRPHHPHRPYYPTPQPPTGTTTPPVTTPPVTTPPPVTNPPSPPITNPDSGLSSADTFSLVSGIVGSAAGGAFGTLKSVGNLKLIGMGFKMTPTPPGEMLPPADVDMPPTPIDEPASIEGGKLSSKLSMVTDGIKALGNSALTGAKYGAIFGGAVSALTNGYNVITGKETTAGGVSSLVADTVSGTLSGAGGAVAGGVAALGLSAMGVASLPVTIIATGIGLVGAIGVNLLTKGLHDSLKNKVLTLLGGTPAPTTT